MCALCSRRTFLSAALAVPALGVGSKATFAAPSDPIEITSPQGDIKFTLFWRRSPRLHYLVTFKRRAVIERSPLGISVDGRDLCAEVEVERVEVYRLKERYPWRGVHAEAINDCRGAIIFLKDRASGIAYRLEARAFDDGIAFRYIVPGDDRPKVVDETAGFKLPAGSAVWYHGFEGHYEGIHTKKALSAVSRGEWAAPPLTIELPNGAGYASITEAALINYSGMGLQADGEDGFALRLAHLHPVSYPFNLRYGAKEAKRLSVPAAIGGTIISPWRVVMIGADLNTLVNCDIIHNVSPPPDPKLFPAGFNTPWIKPGRAVWRYLDGGDNTLEGMKEFSGLAGQLGFEYNIVEGFWQRWPVQKVRELAAYSRGQGVGIWLWKHSRELRTPEARRQFFELCRDVGAVGAKIDFFDHEAKEIIDLYQALLREAAEFQIMINFHGANKPTGEMRTWPNELTREAVRGMEYSRMATRAQHNTTLPFTRFLAGPADYTPMHFGARRAETSWAHQIASAAVFTSPLLTFAAHPQKILDHPAVEMIRSLPSVWDETIALPLSRIGEIAAFARRRGETWFLAIMNGPAARTVRLPLSFLDAARYAAPLVRDQPDEAAAVVIERAILTRRDDLTIALRAGGGFIGKFEVQAMRR
jgi:alpha-glucosidase